MMVVVPGLSISDDGYDQVVAWRYRLVERLVTVRVGRRVDSPESGNKFAHVCMYVQRKIRPFPMSIDEQLKSIVYLISADLTGSLERCTFPEELYLHVL